MEYFSYSECEQIFMVKELKNYVPLLGIKEQYPELSSIGLFPRVCLDEYIKKFLFHALTDNIDEDEKKITKHEKLYNYIHSRYGVGEKSLKLTKLSDKKYRNFLTLANPGISIDDKKLLEKKLQEAKLKLQAVNIHPNFLLSHDIEEDNSKIVHIVDLLMEWRSSEKEDFSIFDDVRNLFSFANETEMHNLYGCLGLFLIDSFLTCYKKDNIRSILYLIVIIDRLYRFNLYTGNIHTFCINMQKKYAVLEEKEIKKKKDCQKAGATTKNAAFKQFCVDYYNENKGTKSKRQIALWLAEYYQNNPKEISVKFPGTKLTTPDPYTTIYNSWLSPKSVSNILRNKEKDT